MNEVSTNNEITLPIQEKWGHSVTAGETGFQAIPDVLIKSQTYLGLDAIDMNILLNILMHWWTPEELPHPRPSVIAKRMNVSTRTVERHIEKMTKLNLIERLPSEEKVIKATGETMNVRRFKLSKLIGKLETIAMSIQQKH